MGGLDDTNVVSILPPENSIPFAMWRAAFLISLPSFVHGYVVASLNACLVKGSADDADRCFNGDDDGPDRCPKGTLYNDMKLTTENAQLATSLVIVGAYVGCLLGSTLSERFGRRKAILWNNTFFFLGALLCSGAFGDNIDLLFIGRTVAGFGFGIETVIVPVLLSEVARPESRGKLTVMHQIGLTSGIMAAGIIGYGLVSFVDHGWRYVQVAYAIPSVIMVICAYWIPESPKWLVGKQRIQDAEDALRIVRNLDFCVEKEVEELIEQDRDKNMSSDQQATWSEVFAYKKAVIIGIGLQLSGSFSGINTVIFYSATIFGFAGVDDAILAAAAVGVVNVFSTAISASLVDKLGRRTLLLGGTYLMAFSLILLSVVLLSANQDEKSQGIVAVMAVLMFVFGYAIGLGAVSWVVMAEIMPTRLRTKAYGMFVSISYGANLLIGLFTLSVIYGLGGVSSSMDDEETNDAEKNGVAYLYFILAGVCIFAITFITFVVPETKGRKPEDFMVLEDAAYSPILKRDVLESDVTSHEY